MTEIEPLKIWATSGAIAVTIMGMTVIQIRSTGSSLAEVAASRTSSTESTQTESANWLSNQVIYESGYAGGYVPRTFRTNPLLPNVSPAYIGAVRFVYDNSEADEPVTDVEQDPLLPELANADPSAIMDATDQAAAYQFVANKSAPDDSDVGLQVTDGQTYFKPFTDIAESNVEAVNLRTARFVGDTADDPAAQSVYTHAAIGDTLAVIAMGDILGHDTENDVADGPAVPGWVFPRASDLNAVVHNVDPVQTGVQIPPEVRAYLGDTQAQGIVIQQAFAQQQFQSDYIARQQTMADQQDYANAVLQVQAQEETLTQLQRQQNYGTSDLSLWADDVAEHF